MGGLLLFEADFFGERAFHFDEGIEEFLSGAAVFDAIDEGMFEAFVACDGDEVTGGEAVHVAAVAFAEGAVFGVEGDFIAIQQGIVGTGLGEELDDEGDGVDQHEEEGEDDVGGEGELSTFVTSLEEAVEGEGLGEDVAARFGLDGGDALVFIFTDGSEFVLCALEFLESGVDLLFDRFAEGVLLGDEGAGLVFLDLAFELCDAVGFGFVGFLDLSQFVFEGCDGAFFSFADLGLEGGFFLGEVFEEAADAFGFFASRFELIGSNGAGAWTFASESGALAIEFSFEFRLPESQFGLDFIELGGEFIELGIDDGQAIAEGFGGFSDGVFEFLLLFRGGAGDGGGSVFAVLEDELGLEGFVPFFALGGDIGFELGDSASDLFFVLKEVLADRCDLGGALVFNDRVDGVAEEKEDEGVGDGEAHEDGDDEAERELREFSPPGEEWAVAGEEGAVDGEDDECPDPGDRVDDAWL